MPQRIRSSRRSEFAVKLLLTALFLAIFAIFALTQRVEDFHISVFDFVLLGLATFRLGRLVAYDPVFEPLREPFTVTAQDPTGAGETVEPKGVGFQYAFGQLISCPICSGTWIAAGLIYGLYFFPGPAHIFLWIAAAIGMAQLIGSLVEALSWSGQLARTQAGALDRSKEPDCAGGDAVARHLRGATSIQDNSITPKYDHPFTPFERFADENHPERSAIHEHTHPSEYRRRHERI